MKSVNEQLAEMQKKAMESMEPMQNMNSLAAEAFERIARKNYDLMGDLVDYAVSQVKAPSNPQNLQEVYEQKVADTQAFAEKVNSRAKEYVELATELGELAQAKTAATVEAATTAASNAAPAPAKAEAAGGEPAAKKKAAAKKTAAKAK